MHAPGIGGPDALVGRECVPQLRGSFDRVLAEKAPADSFHSACFLERRAKLAGDGERLTVVPAGLLGRRGPES